MSRGGRQNPPGVDGFVNLNKAPGMTSMDVLRRIKGITGQRHKVGHGGTMDPLAHGVLPICFGQATRLMDHLIQGPKGYRMEVHLGVTTTTYDAEGEVVKTAPVGDLTREMVERALPAFIGTIQQIPPMYSAVKIQGQRLYKLARAGIEVDRQARTVELHDIQIRGFQPPKLVLDVECGRGVYMRSLAHDLGESLGCGGYVTDLTRLHAGGFRLESAVTLEDLERANASDPAGWQQYLYPVDWVLRGLKSISVGRSAEQCLRNGQSISLGRLAPEAAYLERFRAYSTDGRFLALVRFEPSDNLWRPIKVFHSSAPSPHAPVSAQP